MNTNTNLPADSINDPRAPFNQSERHLCTFCDKDEINEMWWAIEEKLIADMSEDGDLTENQCRYIDAMEDSFRSQFRACKNCDQ
jgi:hypothetical protein